MHEVPGENSDFNHCENPNSITTQPYITLVGLDTKMTLHTPPKPLPQAPQKLNVSNISAVTDPILMKL